MLKSSFKRKSKSIFSILLGLAFLVPSTSASAVSTESIGNDLDSNNIVSSTPEPSSKVLTAGTYEETDEAITYSGNWTSQEDASFSGGKGIYSLTPGSYATFKFEGTGFSWYGLSTQNRGIASITIDDETISLDTATVSYLNKNNIYTRTDLAYGTHTVKIAVTNSKNESSTQVTQFIDYLQIYNSDPVDKILHGGIYEENADGLDYYGVWTDQQSTLFNSGAGKYSLNPGSYVTFKFEGTGFAWYAYATPNRGIANVTIDGETSTVDTSYKCEIPKKDVYTVTGLTPGVHTVKLEVTNDKNATSNAVTQFIDYLEIYETDPPSQVLKAGKYEEDNEAIKYYGNWITQEGDGNSGGYGKYSLDAGSYFTFSFEGTGFSWYSFATRNRGFANITIDGVPFEKDTSFYLTIYKKNVYTINGLDYGIHNVKIEVTDRKQEYSSMITQFIDYIEIYDHDTILTPGKHEESDPGLHYSGNWMNHFSDANSNGIGKYSYEEGADVSFNFNGTGFSWYSLVTPNRGIAKVTVDDVEYNVDNSDSAITFKKELFTLNNLEYGIHNVTIQVTGNSGATASSVPTVFVDYINVYDSTAVIPNLLTPGKYEEDSDGLIYTGSWVTQSNDNFSGGSGKYSYGSNNYVEFTFEGNGFNWYSYTTPNRGIARIIIDDDITNSIIVDTSNDITSFQNIVFSKTDLSYGIHNAKIVVTGDKNPNSNSTTQFIDAIEIL